MPTWVRLSSKTRERALHHTYTPAELARRMARVRVLIETHDDVYDDLSRCETASAGKSGFADPITRTRVCGFCFGEGCGHCDNQGRVTFEERDPYDTGVGAFNPTARDQRDDAARVDAILERIQQDQLLREGLTATVDFEAALERAGWRDERGSYRELRLAADSMPRTLRGDVAVRWLAEHLPRTIRVPRWAFDRELELLGEQVVRHKADGLDAQQIAQALSVSRRQVRRLLREARSK